MSRPKAQSVTVDPAPPPEPNERDKAAIAFASARVLARRKRAAIVVVGKASAVQVASPHSDHNGHSRQMLDAFGTASNDFANGALTQLLNAIADKASEAPGQASINAALAVVGGTEPANEVEALLASQMAATHGLGNDDAGADATKRFAQSD